MNTRTDIINLLFSRYKFQTYLEIGVSNPEENFNKINAVIKDSVDPAPSSGKYKYNMTSDEFFRNHAKNRYDVIFVDGLHTEAQVYDDVHNAIRYLNDDGFIVVHDCNPATEFHARSYEEFQKTGGPWNGTVYKAFIQLKHELPDWSCFVINEDHGCGIITKRKIIENKRAEYNRYNLTWEEFANRREELLQLVTFNEYDKNLIPPVTLMQDKKSLRIKIVSNSAKDDLYQHSRKFYESMKYDKIIVSGKNGLHNFEFFDHVITNPSLYDFDWMVYIDEDCFITDLNALEDLIKFQIENNIHCSGMPDGGVISHRFHNPIGINPFFCILNLTEVRKKYNSGIVRTMRYGKDLDKHIPHHLIKKNMPYDPKFTRTIAAGYTPYGVIYDDFEKYYMLHFWLLRNNYNMLYLDGYDYSGDDLTTVLKNHKGVEFAYHAWFARGWENPSHRNRMLNLIDYCNKIKVPMRTKEEQAKIDKEYIDKEDYIRNFDDNWHRTHITYTITKQYSNLLGVKCANLGSNSGYICYLAAEFQGVNEVVGFDINQKALDFGDIEIRKRFPEDVAKRVKFKYSNLMNLDSESNHFDSIITYHTLEHIFQKDLNQVVSEMCRVLKQGGHVIISIPYERAFYTEGQHVTFFNEKTLSALYEANGFETVECYKDLRFSDYEGHWCLTALFKKK